ncbi:hypothetical protein BpHYR1_009983 [Brachionus plicatilis]|uniref:Uncharacterized protein n=1 Tax=Brachionus plicatilis TaxID=10195 RepID=A0A3M7RGK1_BRAPC|nr:hypothetical protein BpHYR1_009983 [Brachionus plicatilis]
MFLVFYSKFHSRQLRNKFYFHPFKWPCFIAFNFTLRNFLQKLPFIKSIRIDTISISVPQRVHYFFLNEDWNTREKSVKPL